MTNKTALKVKKRYHVYILLCADKTLYTGITNDLARRLAQHKAGTASHYTRAHKVKKIVYSEICKNKGLALKREFAIKQLSRAAKLDLLKRFNKAIE